MNKKTLICTILPVCMMFANVARAQAPKIMIEQAKLIPEEIRELKTLLDYSTSAQLKLQPTDSITVRELLDNGNTPIEGGIAEDGAFNIPGVKYGDSWRAFLFKEERGYYLCYDIMPAGMVFIKVAKPRTSRVSIEQAELSDEEINELKALLDHHSAQELKLFACDSISFRELLDNGNTPIEGGIAEDGAFNISEAKYGDSWSAFICREHGGYCLCYEVTDGKTMRTVGGYLTEALKPE